LLVRCGSAAPRLRSTSSSAGRGAAFQYCRMVGGLSVTSLMFDSDEPAALGTIQFLPARVATYADLLTPQILAEFGSRLAVIDRGLGDPMNRAHIVDIEQGAHTVASGSAAIKAWHAEGRQFLTVYVNRGNWDAVLAACLPVRPYSWVATLDGTLNPNGKFPHLTQFASESALGLHADVSVVWDEGWLPQHQAPNPVALSALRGGITSLGSIAAQMNQAIAGL
jgi:hypothetical protein